MSGETDAAAEQLREASADFQRASEHLGMLARTLRTLSAVPAAVFVASARDRIATAGDLVFRQFGPSIQAANLDLDEIQLHLVALLDSVGLAEEMLMSIAGDAVDAATRFL